MIDLHYTGTPNGQKIALMLEEVDLPYRVISYDIFEGDQLTPEFGQINPNHKLPAIVDTEPDDGPEPLSVFESGAILQYLAEKTGRFLPLAGRARSRAIQWLTWQVSGLGPMGGQASHFLRYAPAGQDYAVDRYVKEYDRLLRVLGGHLSASPFLAGDDYTIADMAVWPGWAGSLHGRGAMARPAIDAWFERVAERPAAKRVLARADLAAPPKYLGRKRVLSPAEWSNMFGERLHAAVNGPAARG